ncbi:laminin subunit beta-1 isoform X2 [Brevipalpus obovatus]|uniref:laminin subunit beta-1 isoform X2 n=1 Tax=Brevipalpus obovatus TaxID=246614 RepID=UPI003D9EDF33
MDNIFILIFVCFTFFYSGYSDSCDRNSCAPQSADLLVGRAENLSSTSTCGLTKAETYCILAAYRNNPTEPAKCKTCYANPRGIEDKWRNHEIKRLVTDERVWSEWWWQSENGVQNVSIRLDLEAEFLVTHVVMVFRFFRPAAMFIERSQDYGKTWKVYQYFSARCDQDFPNVPTGERGKMSDVTCISQYSAESPSTYGEVIYKALPPYMNIRDPFSDEVLDILKATNIRVNFTRLHTFGDNLLDFREEIRQKYYYAVANMRIHGTCSCYGHANRCLPGENQKIVPGMVYGNCECKHHTKPPNCRVCEDFYWDVPWRPARGEQINECKRCNCHNHATKCHFDEMEYIRSGNVSGGVCEDCQHNTMGVHCEQCKPLFYRSAPRRMDDPYVCQACECDAKGIIDSGSCDSTDDPLTSGQCHCKKNVGGRRCNECKPGFWNFLETNPEGCQECACNINGTRNNAGCDQATGKCVCKAHVIGRDCNQCEPNYYGLGLDPEGCKPCDCDPGGSFDSQCDLITGTCRCRPHVTGRRCDQIEESFYAPVLDRVYDAEDSSHSPETRAMPMKTMPDRPSYWTGSGYLQMYPGSTMEFEINDIPKSMNYFVILRYSRFSSQFPSATIRIEPLSGSPPSGSPCLRENAFTGRSMDLPIDNTRLFAKASSPVCFDRGYRYRVKVQMGQDFSRGNTSTLAIDSVAVIPNFNELEMFKDKERDPMFQQFQRYSCGDNLNSMYRHNIESCNRMMRSISLYVNSGALPCDCDLEGSSSTICDPDGGKCTCRSKTIVGRRCDQCEALHYGFSSEGCKPCDCHPTGSEDQHCNPINGNCKCHKNTYGRRCDECQPGFWNYPNCQRCECNGHAEKCDSKTGVCVNCLQNTAGDHCDKCANGYYGNPILGINIPCQPCPCPGVPGSSNFHATSCEYDPVNQVPRCFCKPGYKGDRCDQCSNNFYGDPTLPGGECRQCDCSNNIDATSMELNCDPSNGRCLKCLYNTEGDHCERCRKGYYGNALLQQCTECVCNRLGTNMTIGSISVGPRDMDFSYNMNSQGRVMAFCDQQKGQCPCLPNVVGRECDRCAENHFNLTSGKGCESCECDPQGSLSLRCDEISGQCQCRPGRGGRRCNECIANHYGDPRTECHPCECNPMGSKSMQCNQHNGACDCIKGISGKKCDQCARGYLGTAPRCESCGECFENWDVIIQKLKNDTITLMENARTIRITGAPGAYRDSFMDIENSLTQLGVYMTNVNSSEQNIDALRREVDVLRRKLDDVQKRLSEEEKSIEDVVNRNTNATMKLAGLQRNAKELENLNRQLKENATNLKADDAQGAYNLTQEAYRSSLDSQSRVTKAMLVVTRSENMRQNIERILNTNLREHGGRFADNSGRLRSIEQSINELEGRIPNINQKVCGSISSTVDHCDPVCGGAGCQKCGDQGCVGSTSIANDSVTFAKNAEDLLQNLNKQSNSKLQEISEARTRSADALRESKKAYEAAMRAKNSSELMSREIQDLFNSIDNFLNSGGARPEDIKSLAEECLKIQISLTPDKIIDLANKINATLKNIQDIDRILAETKGDLFKAEDLDRRANETRMKADDVLNIAQQVVEILFEAERSQQSAENAIRNANTWINGAQADLDEIGNQVGHIEANAIGFRDKVNSLENRMENVNKNQTLSQYMIDKSSQYANQAGDAAREAEKESKDLEALFQQARELLSSKEGESGLMQEKSNGLRARAEKLATEAQGKIELLQSIEDDFDENEKKLNRYADDIDKLNAEVLNYLKVIEERSIFHKNCQN